MNDAARHAYEEAGRAACEVLGLDWPPPAERTLDVAAAARTWLDERMAAEFTEPAVRLAEEQAEIRGRLDPLAEEQRALRDEVRDPGTPQGRATEARKRIAEIRDACRKDQARLSEITRERGRLRSRTNTRRLALEAAKKEWGAHYSASTAIVAERTAQELTAEDVRGLIRQLHAGGVWEADVCTAAHTSPLELERAAGRLGYIRMELGPSRVPYGGVHVRYVTVAEVRAMCERDGLEEPDLSGYAGTVDLEVEAEPIGAEDRV